MGQGSHLLLIIQGLHERLWHPKVLPYLIYL